MFGRVYAPRDASQTRKWVAQRMQADPRGYEDPSPTTNNIPELTEKEAGILKLAMAHLATMPSKLTEDDVWADPFLTEVAQIYVSTYRGDFDFMRDLQRDAAVYGFSRWTGGKYRGALNCLRAEALREQRQEREKAGLPAPGAVEVGTKTIPLGTYTAVFADGSHRTIRVKKHWEEAEAKRGVKVVQYLSGSDNESSYTGFAFLNGTQVRVWRKFAEQFKADGTLLQALKIVMGDPAKAGEAYALESSHCFRCGRKLTVPVSIHRGLGPECATKWGA